MERKDRAHDGIGDRAVEKLKQMPLDIAKAWYHQLGVSWQQGMQELANALYQGTPVPVPQNLTVSQMDKSDLMTHYEANLNRASEKAQQQQPEQEMER